MIFIIGSVFTKKDVLKMGRVLLVINILMTVIVYFQFSSPQSAFINVGIGGEGSAGFSGAMGYSRPPGTFSFTTGLSIFKGDLTRRSSDFYIPIHWKFLLFRSMNG